MPDTSTKGGTKVSMPSGPLPMHKRMAAGNLKAGTEKNPNGSGPPTQKKVGNAKVTY